MAALAEAGATREEICNAFGVPASYFTAETNLANMEAAERQHMTTAIRPRVKRRDEKLNQQLVPLFAPSGRLFFASDNPVSSDRAINIQQERNDLIDGVRTDNEIRFERGLPPVPWGDRPYTQVREIVSDNLDEPNTQMKPR